MNNWSMDLPRLQLQVGSRLITVQVASTAAQRSTGLTGYRHMPATPQRSSASG